MLEKYLRNIKNKKGIYQATFACITCIAFFLRFPQNRQ